VVAMVGVEARQARAGRTEHFGLAGGLSDRRAALDLARGDPGKLGKAAKTGCILLLERRAGDAVSSERAQSEALGSALWRCCSLRVQ
jgi:hypothetical protein